MPTLRLSLLLFIAVLALSITSSADDLVVTKERLYTLPEGHWAGDLAMYTDGIHWAFLCTRENDHVVIRDGVVGPSLDLYEGFVFSPDLTRYATHVPDEKQEPSDKWETWIVVDGVKQKVSGYADQMCFSPNGKHFSYTSRATDDEHQLVWILDGVEKVRLKSEDARLTYSPDGERWVCYYSWGGGGILVDGVRHPDYGAVDEPIFSPDGKHLAYIAGDEDAEFMVLDGKKHKTHSLVDSPLFSPDGNRFAYVASDDPGEQFVVLDGVEQKRHGVGRAAAAKASKGKANTKSDDADSMDEENLTPSARIATMVFSPDSKHFAYAVTENGKVRVVLDGVELNAYPYAPNPLGSEFALSPDGKHLAYWVWGGKMGKIVVDGVETEVAHVAFNFLFSADGEHLTYLNEPNGDIGREMGCDGSVGYGPWRTVVDGIAQEFVRILVTPKHGVREGEVFYWYGWSRDVPSRQDGLVPPGSTLYRYSASIAASQSKQGEG